MPGVWLRQEGCGMDVSAMIWVCQGYEGVRQSGIMVGSAVLHDGSWWTSMHYKISIVKEAA